jgi:hypothetical protein
VPPAVISIGRGAARYPGEQDRLVAMIVAWDDKASMAWARVFEE